MVNWGEHEPTGRNLDAEAAIMINELDSLRIRVDLLQPHPRYTDALNFIAQALVALKEGRSEIHHRETKARYKGAY